MRILILTIGPLIIVGACYCLTMLGSPISPAPSPGVLSSSDHIESQPPTRQSTDLFDACRRQAARTREQLGGHNSLIVRPPYVIAGEFTEDELDRYHRLIIVPIERALSTAYFDAKPDRPITVLLFASGESFRHNARRIDQRSVSGEYGYYHREDRRIVVNAATGNGTIAHELTHALAGVDFPRIPAWFDEGLASLHEQCEFSDDRLRLTGLSNWRLSVLREALRRDELESLESLISRGSIPQERADVDYAHARYFCLYLESRRLLAPFYRKFRRSANHDPTGLQTLRSILQDETLEETESAFRLWLETLPPREPAQAESGY